MTTVAQSVAKGLGVAYEGYDVTLPNAREATLTFGATDLVVLGTPVIAGRVPNLLLPYLNSKLVGGGAYAVPMVSFGNRNYDDALIELRNIAEEVGFRTIGGGAFVSQHSFSTVLAAGRPDDADKEKMLAFGAQLVKKIQSDWSYTAPAFVKGHDPIRPYFKPEGGHGEHIDIRKVKPITTEACCGCGICVAVCPLGSISAEDPTKTVGICMKCCACVKKCPTGAKQFSDAGFLFHKVDLEETYAQRAEADYFI